jgi:hypothetical protein
VHSLTSPSEKKAWLLDLIKSTARLAQYHLNTHHQLVRDSQFLLIELGKLEYGLPGEEISVRIAGKVLRVKILFFDSTIWSDMPVCVVENINDKRRFLLTSGAAIVHN